MIRERSELVSLIGLIKKSPDLTTFIRDKAERFKPYKKQTLYPNKTSSNSFKS
ncbi:MAG: hypothetical protein GBAus27B_000070 [Mycoplasmataceae bacterium]|nr:MAG: hypothetical protein GBAus27B_000070 [Mycoplasmataceae bacterium]